MAISLGLVVLADWLFYAQPIGWTATLYGLALLAAVTLRGGGWIHRWTGRCIALGLLGLGLAVVIEPGPLPVTLGVLGLVSLAMIDRGGWTHRVAELAWRWGLFAIRSLTQPIRDARLSQRWQRTHRRGGVSLRWAAVWGLPVLGSLVFIAMFAMANPVVSRGIRSGWERASHWLTELPELLAPWRIGLWLLAGFGAWALLRV